MASDIQTRIAELSQQLHRHIYQYHVRSEPLITDAEYDRLLQELQTLEAEHPQYLRDESPTQRVGSDLSGDFSKLRHPAPILSLANAFDEADLLAWEERNLRLLPAGTQPFLYLAAQAGWLVHHHHLREWQPGAGGDARQWRNGRRCHRQCQDDSLFAPAHPSRLVQR